MAYCWWLENNLLLGLFKQLLIVLPKVVLIVIKKSN